MQGKYLITTDSWFHGPDGKQYRAVWGEVKILSDEILGLKTNARSSNWFARIGTETNHVIVAGCQIHYALKTEKEPNAGPAEDYSVDEGKVAEYFRPSHIYIAK
jgi:hypothetical protein